ncbi:hypothetical protein [Actinomadura decatromicini]|uniref:Bacteriophage Mu GpT domain-containing protein n=1 Tax=Actinomadura decatromicini TaxID=2604572 RepID=A0A5D3FTY8_9ACTN|nr:hypothetical protein [Actinomadura decatromicini]TYK50575.1 hypothetical protein FXF68_08645 [Actinomadura decatromicini]
MEPLSSSPVRACEAEALGTQTPDTRTTDTDAPPSAVETVREEGRLLEALGTDAAGGRVFAVRIIAYGDSKNGRRYPPEVMRRAVGLYEGARAYDHHRTAEELQSSTIAGMIGYFADARAADDGIHADLHLLPSASQAAEALDASLAVQALGAPPLVGISHDVMAHYKPVSVGGRRMQEAIAIAKVHSADVVADPAAGGQITRMVAGGLGAAGDEGQEDAGGNRGRDDGPDGRGGGGAAELLHDAGTARGRQVIAQESAARGLPPASIEHVTRALPARFSEAQLSAVIDAIQAATGTRERAELRPAAVQVTTEARDKKVAALDEMLSYQPKGPAYRSLREAYMDLTGARPDFLGEDFNRRILRESFGAGFDSAMRAAESMDSASWAQVLGDAVTRRLIAEYGVPNLMVWQQIVSSTPTGLDFRTQRRGRVGGYGTLPTVAEGQPYQPLPSPPDEEATYAITKKGGTEDLTLEMIANDDIQALRSIPFRLGRAASQTLYRFVFDFFPTNAATTYDATALFHTNHANTDNPAALGQSALSAGRRKMRRQAAYGDGSDILSIVPKFLIVPTDLEELAYQLCSSEHAIPSTGNDPADRPNIHRGLVPLVIDYYADASDWFLTADPMLCPTIEIGFYGPTTEPELFTQSDPNVGSMFNADKFTYKIRHVYSGTVLDHRGMYRGSN